MLPEIRGFLLESHNKDHSVVEPMFGLPDFWKLPCGCRGGVLAVYRGFQSQFRCV